MVEEYNLTINRIPSSNIDFNDIKIIDNLNINHLNNFDFNIYEYNIEVSSEVEYVILSANIHEDATATNLGRHNVKLDETIEILFKVTAEDGTESAEYIFNITKRSLSNNNKLNNISIKDPKDSSILLLGDSIYKPLNIFDKKD